jgi:solute:Na+ symporter, SSS family
VAKLAKIMVLFITATALGFAIYSSTTLVSLLLLGYDGVTQFFPGVVLGLYSRRVTKLGVLTGLIVGITVVSFLVLSHRDPFFGLNAGLVALAINFAVTAAVSFLTSAQTSSSDQSLPAAAIAGSGHIG